MKKLVRTYVSGYSFVLALLLAADAGSRAATPIVWFKADAIIGVSSDSPLATWIDASGHANNAIAPTTSACPTYVADAMNGLPAVRFSEFNSTCLNFPRAVQDDFTIVCVFQSTQGLDSGSLFYQGAGLVNGEVVGCVGDFGTCLFANGQVCAGTGNPDVSVASGAGYNDGMPHVLVFKRVRATGTMSLYVDGVFAGSAVASTASLTAPPQLTLGAQQSGANYFSGDIAEVQLYNSALIDSDRQNVELSLLLKYGLSPAPRVQGLFWGPGDPVYEGASVDFLVSAQGFGSLSYQWQKDGVDLLAATNSTFTLPKASTADSGAYAVVVTSADGSAISTPVALAILAGPAPAWLDYARLTAGVTDFLVPETDTVAIWGRNAFPIVGQQGDLRSHRAMAGAGFFNDDTNRARAVIFGSPNYFPGNSGGDAMKQTLCERAVRWTSRKSIPATITVGVTTIALDGVPAALAACGYRVKAVNAGTVATDLNGCDVLIMRWSWFDPWTDADIRAITNFCAAGGGLVAGEVNWYMNDQAWSRMSAVLGPFGLKQSPYGDGSVPATNVVATPFPRYSSALPAIDLVLSAKAGQTNLSTLALWTCLDTLDAAYYTKCLNVPETAADPLGNNVPELNAKMAQLEAYYGWITPSRSHQITLWTMPYETLLTRYQARRLANWPLTNAFVHPGAADYPGLPTGAAAPTNVTVALNGNTPANFCSSGDWYVPAGVCASPSNAVAVVIPSALVSQGLQLLVGNVIDGHDLSGWKRDPNSTDLAWQRFPVVAFSTPLTQAVTLVRNPFGGLLTITVPSGKALGTFNVAFTNVFEAPMFFLGKTTDADWNNGIKNRPGPWGCLIASTRWMTYAPSWQLRALTNPTTVAQMWNTVISNEDWCLGCESFRVKPEAVIPQRQLSNPGAYAWSTDPICSLDGYDQEVYLATAPSGYNYYGMTHEVGHHMAGKLGDLLTLNAGENSANIPVSAVDFLAKDGTSWDSQGWPAAQDRLAWRNNYNSWAPAQQTWDTVTSGYNGVGGDFHMDFFCNLAEAFGWQLYHDALSRYQQWRAGGPDPELQYVSSYDQDTKQNTLYYLFCCTAQRNLDAYFAAYGLGVAGKGYEIADAVKSLIAAKGYPTWTTNQPVSAIYGPPDGQLTVPKNAPPGTIVFQWQAEDPDLGQVFEYKILSGNTGFAWEIDKRTGVLQVNPSLNGLQGDYFSNATLTGAPVLTRQDPNINFDWGYGSPDGLVPSDYFSVRWTGSIVPRYSERYTFTINSDNGRRVWVNNQLIIDKWTNDWGIDYSGSINLVAGQRYAMKVEFFEYDGAANCKLWWQSASQSKEIVPQSQLLPPGITDSAMPLTQNTYTLQVAVFDCGVPRYSLTNSLFIQTTAPSNTAPVLTAIPGRVLTAGATLSFTASATDTDQPRQTLTFSLVNPPLGAVVNPTSGLFTWRPAIAQSPGTNFITLCVSDNGSPPLSATQTFCVTVNRPAFPLTSAVTRNNGLFQFQISGDSGPDYIVEGTTNLASPEWSPLTTNLAPTPPFTWTDPTSMNAPQRFYRVRLAP
jgi:hypothetical protein